MMIASLAYLSRTSVPKGDGWQARLELDFEPDRQHTIMRSCRHHGPLRVLRNYHPEGDPCHCYIIHPPGGVVGGDQLSIQARLKPASHSVLTTPAATKFYRSSGARAHIEQSFVVHKEAKLEWLPAMNIFHGGAQVQMQTNFYLERETKLLAWEISAFGRRGSEDFFVSGSIDTRLSVFLDQSPVFLERQRFFGSNAVMSEAWGLKGFAYQATFLVWPADAGLRDAFRDEIRSWKLHEPHGLSAATLLNAGQDRGLLVIRCLADCGDLLWRWLLRARDWLRPHVLGIEAYQPRIWAT